MQGSALHENLLYKIIFEVTKPHLPLLSLKNRLVLSVACKDNEPEVSKETRQFRKKVQALNEEIIAMQLKEVTYQQLRAIFPNTPLKSSKSAKEIGLSAKAYGQIYQLIIAKNKQKKLVKEFQKNVKKSLLRALKQEEYEYLSTLLHAYPKKYVLFSLDNLIAERAKLLTKAAQALRERNKARFLPHLSLAEDIKAIMEEEQSLLYHLKIEHEQKQPAIYEKSIPIFKEASFWVSLLVLYLLIHICIDDSFPIPKNFLAILCAAALTVRYYTKTDKIAEFHYNEIEDQLAKTSIYQIIEFRKSYVDSKHKLQQEQIQAEDLKKWKQEPHEQVKSSNVGSRLSETPRNACTFMALETPVAVTIKPVHEPKATARQTSQAGATKIAKTISVPMNEALLERKLDEIGCYYYRPSNFGKNVSPWLVEAGKEKLFKIADASLSTKKYRAFQEVAGPIHNKIRQICADNKPLLARNSQGMNGFKPVADKIYKFKSAFAFRLWYEQAAEIPNEIKALSDKVAKFNIFRLSMIMPK